jgi:hypothetical protein
MAIEIRETDNSQCAANKILSLLYHNTEHRYRGKHEDYKPESTWNAAVEAVQTVVRTISGVPQMIVRSRGTNH